MDNLTDLLTNIFVSGRTRPIETRPVKKEEKEQEPKHVSEKSSSSSEEDSTSSDSRSETSSSKSKSTTSENKNESESENSSDDSESDNESESESESEKTSDDDNENDNEDNNENDNEDDNDKKQVEKASVDNKVQEVKSEKNEPEPEPVSKTILKASDFYKKNLLLVNHESKKNLEILGDLLYKLSKMNNVSEIYDNSLHIFTFSENKKNFRDMLLENPYLYFTNFVIKTHLSNLKFDSSKRHIVIVDFDTISDMDKLPNLLRDNVQLIVLHNSYNHYVLDVYKLLGKNCLLINKKDRLKLLQKRFYSKIVKHLSELKETHYFDTINDENLDAKLLIIRNGQFRYS